MSTLTPTIPTIIVSPRTASDAYLSTDMLDSTGSGAIGSTQTGSFGATLTRAMQGAIDSGHAADAQSMQAIAGGGNITDVVTAVSKAELTLQTATSIRDKMVSAYQEIMRMAI